MLKMPTCPCYTYDSLWCLAHGALYTGVCYVQVPSYGILTNGYMYQFFKYYMDESNNKVLVQSRVQLLNIESAKSHKEALVAVITIVKRVVHILRAQVLAISQSRDLKKARNI